MYDLDRFLTAQRRDYAAALREIQNGRKRSHWIWYICLLYTSPSPRD